LWVERRKGKREEGKKKKKGPSLLGVTCQPNLRFREKEGGSLFYIQRKKGRTPTHRFQLSYNHLRWKSKSAGELNTSQEVGREGERTFKHMEWREGKKCRLPSLKGWRTKTLQRVRVILIKDAGKKESNLEVVCRGRKKGGIVIIVVPLGVKVRWRFHFLSNIIT